MPQKIQNKSYLFTNIICGKLKFILETVLQQQKADCKNIYHYAIYYLYTQHKYFLKIFVQQINVDFECFWGEYL